MMGETYEQLERATKRLASEVGPMTAAGVLVRLAMSYVVRFGPMDRQRWLRMCGRVFDSADELRRAGLVPDTTEQKECR